MGNGAFLQRRHRPSRLGFCSWLGCPASSEADALVTPLGAASYEIYLSHMFVILPVVGLAHDLGLPAHWGWVLFLPVLILAFALGSCVDRYFSRPLDRYLLDWFASLRASPARP